MGTAEASWPAGAQKIVDAAGATAFAQTSFFQDLVSWVSRNFFFFCCGIPVGAMLVFCCQATKGLRGDVMKNALTALARRRKNLNFPRTLGLEFSSSDDGPSLEPIFDPVRPILETGRRNRFVQA